DIGLMRGAFEDAVRRAVPVRSVQLRDVPCRWAGRPATRRAAESITLDVPAGDPDLAGWLEASFDPACRLGDWDFQMLGIAAQVAALVLEIERSRTQLTRAGLLPGARQARDGAAPLIGASAVMKNLRSAIERVASTDFTVLLE